MEAEKNITTRAIPRIKYPSRVQRKLLQMKMELLKQEYRTRNNIGDQALRNGMCALYNGGILSPIRVEMGTGSAVSATLFVCLFVLAP